MTRKDYVAIAAALASVRPPFLNPPNAETENVWIDCCRVVGDVFAADNPNFDRVRFVQACMKDLA